MDPRSIDPTEVWVHHVVRGTSGQPTAKLLGRVYFVRSDIILGEDGVNGRQGWQAAQTTAVLDEDGSFTLELPNAAGDDGVLHRRRFAFFTDPDYEPGEEWLEFYREPNDVVFVGTPTDGEKTKSKVVITGKDLNIVLAGALTSEVDVWDGHAPADVLRHYTRLPVLAHGDDTLESMTAGGEWANFPVVSLSSMSADCWTAEARLRWTSARPSGPGIGMLALNVGSLSLQVDMYEGVVALYNEGLTGGPISGKRQGLVVPGTVDLRVVARYDHIFAFVAGELVAELRRAGSWPAVTSTAAYVRGGTASLSGMQVDTLVEFAGRGPAAVIDRQLPGIPSAEGLRAQYWNAAPVYAQHPAEVDRLARLWPLTGDEPAVDHVEPLVNFTGATAPNMPGAYVARWSGAIYLDLASTDRGVKLEATSGQVRAYIGRTLRNDPILSTWSGGSTLSNSSLRSWLGTSEAGWYPIVIEVTAETPALGVVLEDRTIGGAYGVVPTSRLSPFGCYSDVVRYGTHRQVLGDIAQTFGYQWRTEYRSLESGEFPGQLTFQRLIGRQTNQRIREDDMGTEAQVQVAATDVVDGLIADAAGLADPKGSGQLSAQVVDHTRDHLALRQGYESLAEISEAPLLQQRMDSLLALRSSPNEQVGVRPSGQRDLVDTFPLTGTLAKLDWHPGDGVILDLDAIDIKDLSPRQLTTVSWPLRPDGIGAPTVGFRQRPRTVRAAMQRLSRAIYAPRRNYQGSIAILSGSHGGANSAGETLGGNSDAYSRASLPGNMESVVKVVAAVQYVAGAGWRLEVVGVDLGAQGAVASPGRYDVTDAAKAGGLGLPYTWARLISGTSGYYQLALEIWITV
jgi:hypothetical protein